MAVFKHGLKHVHVVFSLQISVFGHICVRFSIQFGLLWSFFSLHYAPACYVLIAYPHIEFCIWPNSFYDHSFPLPLWSIMNFIISGVLVYRYWRVFLNYQKTENVLTAKASRYPGELTIYYLPKLFYEFETTHIVW